MPASSSASHESAARHGAELGSLLASLGELTNRLEGIAKAAQSQPGAARLAADLFAVESTLRTAHRRLDKVVIAIGR